VGFFKNYAKIDSKVAQKLPCPWLKVFLGHQKEFRDLSLVSEINTL
jgi:hypothetical protein